jgi:hypothetical protein
MARHLNEETDHKRPTLTAAVGLNAPSILERLRERRDGRVSPFPRRTPKYSHDPGLPMTTMNGAVADIHVATPTPPPPNGVGVNGNDAHDSASTGTLKFTTGLILPPPDVKCTFSIILRLLI